ncbi:MAG TPA: alpha/beta fold hydrolase [Mycobacteriales bacterium]|nr:alpha/beta fold hydrolase [Mycobacteriales bacterium]
MRITLGDLTFDVRTDGPVDGRPVLLLHGFPQTGRCWEPLAERLTATGLRTLAPDQRGYSPGARPAGVSAYRLDLLVGDAVGLLDALGLAAVDVVGHDWGAVVAWALAAGHPDRVRTLTAVSVPHPAAYAWALSNDADQQVRSAYIRLFQTEDSAERVLLAEGGRRLRAMFGDLDPTAVDGYLAAMSEPGALTAALCWYRALPTAPVTGPVAVPTTYVWSSGDVAVGSVAARRCGRHVTGPYRLVELAGVSHWVPEEAPDALAGAVLDRIAPDR